MKVLWKQDQLGFQKCWLWQFGPGPFEVIDSYPVRSTPAKLGTGENTVEIIFKPGTWFTIAVPEAAPQYRVEYGIRKVTFFHEMWFTTVAD